MCPTGKPPGPSTTCHAPIVHGLNAVPMGAWVAVAAVAALLVIVAPFVIYDIKRRTGRI